MAYNSLDKNIPQVIVRVLWRPKAKRWLPFSFLKTHKKHKKHGKTQHIAHRYYARKGRFGADRHVSGTRTQQQGKTSTTTMVPQATTDKATHMHSEDENQSDDTHRHAARKETNARQPFKHRRYAGVGGDKGTGGGGGGGYPCYKSTGNVAVITWASIRSSHPALSSKVVSNSQLPGISVAGAVADVSSSIPPSPA